MNMVMLENLEDHLCDVRDFSTSPTLSCKRFWKFTVIIIVRNSGNLSTWSKILGFHQHGSVGDVGFGCGEARFWEFRFEIYSLLRFWKCI